MEYVLFLSVKGYILKHSRSISTIDKNSNNSSSAHAKTIKSGEFHMKYSGYCENPYGNVTLATKSKSKYNMYK